MRCTAFYIFVALYICLFGLKNIIYAQDLCRIEGNYELIDSSFKFSFEGTELKSLEQINIINTDENEYTLIRKLLDDTDAPITSFEKCININSNNKQCILICTEEKYFVKIYKIRRELLNGKIDIHKDILKKYSGQKIVQKNNNTIIAYAPNPIFYDVYRAILDDNRSFSIEDTKELLEDLRR